MVRQRSQSDDETSHGYDEEFTSFYRANLDDVYRYCFFRIGTREAAEDATSEIFIKALRSFGSFRGDGSRRSWLFSIAHNTVVDTHRQKHPTVPIDDFEEIVDSNEGPESVALTITEQNEVRTLLRELPDYQRQILELRLAGLTGMEIAEVLGRTHAAVKIAQLRAYRTLRELLRADDQLDSRESVAHGTD